jgi:hypothetical protein
MVKAYRDARSFMTAVAEMAEALRLALVPMSDIERARLVTKLFSDSEMVFGVWPDPNAEGGVGIHIIKGDDVMPPLEAFTPPYEISIAAIPCQGPRQAVAAREAWTTTRAEKARPSLTEPQHQSRRGG